MDPDFRLLFESLPGKCLVLDPGLTIVAATDEVLAATLNVREDVVGRFIFDVFPDNPEVPGAGSEDNMRASVARVLQLGIADAMPLARHDVRGPAPDFTYEERYWSPTNTPVLDAAGAVAYILHQVEDVTEFVRLQRAAGALAPPTSTADLTRMSAEVVEHQAQVAAMHTQLLEASSRLWQSEQTLREFLDFAPAVISARDLDGRLILRNRHFEPRFERPADHQEGTDRSGPPLGPELLELAEAIEREVIETGEASSTTATIPMPDGETAIFQFSKFPLRTSTGSVYGVGTIATDVTEERRAREELALSEERFREMAEHVDEVFVLWEEGTGRALYVSPAVNSIMGLDAEAFSDPAIRRTVIHPDDVAMVTSGPPPPLMEFRILRPDGEVRWIRSRTSMIETAEGEVNRGVSTLVDFTQRKRSELAAIAARAEAEAANQAKSEFVSRMSHELRTPLNAILGFSQLLAMDELSEGQREEVGHIVVAGEHLLELIDDLLDVSRVETGELRLSIEAVRVQSVVEQAEVMLRPLAERRSVRIALHHSASNAHVRADPQRLRQVLVNLLANAIKYNRDGGDVAVTTTSQGGRHRVTVSDTGFGIAESDVERLFQPFERLSAEHSEVPGTGLGLALTKRLMHAMEGDIGLSSRVGEGSSFWVELDAVDPPASPSEASRRHPTAARHPVTAHQRLLYVEDNLSNVRLVERVLERRPEVELIVALEGRLALGLAKEHQPDLILLDLHLPDIPGTEVLRQLQDDPQTSAIPVVVVSADATTGTARRLLAQGAASYLTKPIEIAGLLALIDGVGERDDAPFPDRSAGADPPPAADGVALAPPLDAPMFAHDLNNVFGVILNYCTLVKRGLDDPSASADIEMIRAAAQEGIELTARLRESH